MSPEKSLKVMRDLSVLSTCFGMSCSGIGVQEMENEGHRGGTKLLPVSQEHVL
jgi:hypothetical protein